MSLTEKEQDPQPCPECAVGKHDNCDGKSWDPVSDGPTECPCAEAGHGLMGVDE